MMNDLDKVTQTPAGLLWTLTQQVDLIDDENSYFLNVASVLPAPAHSVPLLWCGNDEVSLCYSSHVWSHVTRQFHNSTHR